MYIYVRTLIMVELATHDAYTKNQFYTSYKYAYVYNWVAIGQQLAHIRNIAIQLAAETIKLGTRRFCQQN